MSFYVVISTIDSYSNILEQVKLTKSPFQIIVVYANSQTNSFERISPQRINVNIKKNLYEYTAWLGVDLLIKNKIVEQDDWFLMTHDTTLFMKFAVEKIGSLLKVIHRTNIEYYALVAGAFHNICLCRSSGIKNIADYFHTVDTMTKDEARNLETKLGQFVDPSKTGEYAIGPMNAVDVILLPGKKTTMIESVDIMKFYL